MSRNISLSRGKVALVDEADYERVIGLGSWYVLTSNSDRCYAMRHLSRNGKPQKAILMHRFILQATPDQEVDHINGNGLDNRRSNLRFVTRSINVANSKLRSDNRSGCRGVSFRKDRRKWVAQITIDGAAYFLGFFATVSEAAAAYRDASKSWLGTRPMGRRIGDSP